MCAGVSFIMKVQTSWIKLNFYIQILPGTGVFQWNLRNFNTIFEKTNNSVEHLPNRWRFFYGRKVHLLLTPFSKESMEVKKSIKSQPVRYMCLARNKRWKDTAVLSPVSGHCWCRKSCPLTRDVHFFEIWARLALFSKIYYFYTCIWGSPGKWKTSG